MSHEAETLKGNDKIVHMANQIAQFFETMPAEGAAEGVAKHINDFWEPRMRRQFFSIVDAGGDGLRPIVLEAASRVKRPAPEPDRPAQRASTSAQ